MFRSGNVSLLGSVSSTAAFSSKDKQVAFGVLARDYSGKMMEVNYGMIRVSSALVAGAWAIRVACAMTVACGTQNFIIESDSLKDIITMVNGESYGVGRSDHLTRCEDLSSR